ncbi:MAG: alpha amylase C-terminal domain-containing protein [Nitrospinae bacterium]|nr:alpha amylase C-terminal domain-containing protein [Nitrospinota bacterium]
MARPDPTSVLTPLPYRLGAPHGGTWREILNSDATAYGGGGTGNLGKVGATPVGQHGRNHSILITLPPLAAVLFKPYPTISQKS